MKYINKDICTVKKGYIFQICDCVSIEPYGLSLRLENSFPNTSPYSLRKERNLGILGTVMILGNENEPSIVNMFAQYNSGFPKENSIDSKKQRERYFKDCLDSMLDYFEFSDEKIEIAVPYSILNWKHLLLDFEKKAKEELKLDLEITIYKK